jgi:hypothetical protein
MKEFLSLDSSQDAIRTFLRTLGGLPRSNYDFDNKRNSIIKLILNAISKKPNEWDEACQINISWIGESFINSLNTQEEKLTKEKLNDICSMCYRFLIELYLSIKGDLSREFDEAKKYVEKNIRNFDEQSKEQIEFAIYQMPISIFKTITNDESIIEIKNFNSTINKSKELKENWDSDLAKREQRVNALRDSLSEYENGFNFVGLYQGFDELSKEKKTELNNIIFWIRILSLTILTPVAIESAVILMYLDQIDTIKNALFVLILPTASFMGVCIYYFRVMLHNYKSTKSQLLQIELRKTLCRFIQKYSEYSKEIRTRDSNPLEKFENIIFSGIVSDSEQLPSSYDGLEQILKLIKTVKA